jgi:type VI secretion system protein ImpG
MSFEQTYQAELTFLRESGAAFSALHPAIAGMLAERGGDPDVQRLLEGFAFLVARLRQRIDALTPSVSETLLEMVVPQLCRPLPACTIVEFMPLPRQVRGRQKVRAGARLTSKPIQGTPCPFRTAGDVTLLPAAIARQVLDDSSPSKPRVVLALLHDEGLRFYLHGELSICAQLYLWLARHCTGVTLLAGEVSVSLPARHVRVAGEATPLWPWNDFAPRGYQRLLEYFTLPQKFLFADLIELGGVKLPDVESLRVVFEFERPPALPSPFPSSTFRLHCVPAVNLFDVGADPVRHATLQSPQVLRASGYDPRHAEVFSVNSVLGISASGGRRSYPPLLDFRSMGEYYAVRRELSPLDEGINHFISIETSRQGGPPVDSMRVLSVELTCTNRSLPNELGVGDVCIPTPDAPTGVPFNNISVVSRPARPPMAEEAFNAFVSHLASTHRRLTDVQVLRRVLAAYNFQERFDHPTGRINRARIAAIESCTRGPVTRVLEGAAVRGLGVGLTVREDGFASAGDAFLFGCVIDAMLAMQTPLNSFSELNMTLAPGNLGMRWQPRWST